MLELFGRYSLVKKIDLCFVQVILIANSMEVCYRPDLDFCTGFIGVLYFCQRDFHSYDGENGQYAQ